MVKDIIRLDKYRCRIWGCNERISLEVHHIIPRSLGGKNKEWNLITLCHYHHQRITEKKMDMLTELLKIQQSSTFRWAEAVDWLKKRGKNNE